MNLIHLIPLLLFLIINGLKPDHLKIKQNLYNSDIEYQTTVFQPGEAAYDFFRIPSLIVTKNGLLAFAEGRKKSLSDHGQIDLVLKISKDQGKTWGNVIRVVHFNNESCQNPTPVYLPEQSKLMLLFTKRTVASDTEEMIRSGTSEGYIGAYVIESSDGGYTWGEVREISAEVKMENWRWYAFGPGGAIIMKYNKNNTGRIIVPANHSTSGGKEDENLGAHVIFSDDSGNTWNIGAVDSEGFANVNPNETTLVETVYGTLYFNTRSQYFGDEAVSNRAVTYSDDAGESFVRTFFPEPQLLTPVVHASLARAADYLYFIAPNHPHERKKLSLWISRDETLTWASPETVYGEYAAYSSSRILDNQNLGILAEVGSENPYQEIRFFLVSFD